MTTMKRPFITPGGAVLMVLTALGFALACGSPAIAVVTTTGSILDDGTNYYVGYTADGTLRIDAGSLLNKTSVYLGYNSDCTGTSTVSGSGSKLVNSDLYIGNYGSGKLNIQAGGQVESWRDSYLGYYSNSTGTATVTGTGSWWKNNQSLRIGEYGNGTLNLQNGGQVSSYYSIIGNFSGSNGAVSVTGMGSKWTNSSKMYVGFDGTGTLTVANGGEVKTQTLYASPSDLFGNGTITVQGAVLDSDLVFDGTHGLSQALAFGTGGTMNLNVNGTGELGAGHKGTGTLRIADGVRVQSSNGYLGNSLGSNGTVLVTGTGSKWSNNYYLGVGLSGNGTLNIQDGGQVSNREGSLGYYAGSSGTVTVTGTNSTWTNMKDLVIGQDGSGRLTVDNGGIVTAQTIYASLSNLFGNGTITVSGAVLDGDLIFDGTHGLSQSVAFGSGGTLLLNVDGTGALGAGYKGTGTIRIADGQTVRSSFGFLGRMHGSSGNVIVTGTGATWNIYSYLSIGNQGSGSLNIEAGGQVNSNGLSFLTGTCIVTGTGSIWTDNSSDFWIGGCNIGSLNIEAGGQVRSNVGSLGYDPGSHGIISLTGAGSIWTISGGLHVGEEYGSGTLTVADGGFVTANTIYTSLSDLFGDGIISVNGAVLDCDLIFDGTHGITQAIAFGTGGTLNLNIDGTGELGAGYKGTGTLKIANGLTVATTYGYLGYRTGSRGTATVTGSGSKWTNSHELYVGYPGSGTLNIQDGGQVSTTVCRLGYSSGSTGTVTVTGTDSKLTNSDSLFVSGYESTLNIQAGGQVSNAYGYVGYGYGCTGTVMVIGTNSKWTNISDLYVGFAGSGTLKIQAGGQVSNTTGYLGRNSGSVGMVTGMATVIGTSSVWSNTGTLYVGYIGGGSGKLTVADGSKVTAKSLNVSNTQSAVRLHVSGKDMLVLGNATTAGSLTNNGRINLYADAFLPASTYTPISDSAGRTMTWSGTGAYNGIGGTWDDTAKNFTVSAPTALNAGASDTLSTAERLLFTEPSNGKRSGASFGTITGNPTFSATRMTAGELSMLAATPGFEGSVLAAWDYTTSLTASEVMLSYDIGLGWPDPQIWHLHAGAWSPYAPDLETYDSHGILSFTTTEFSGFAITAVPEPATLVLLVNGVLMLGFGMRGSGKYGVRSTKYGVKSIDNRSIIYLFFVPFYGTKK
jgi:fibronectin-binding autotransporter adhesin